MNNKKEKTAEQKTAAVEKTWAGKKTKTKTLTGKSPAKLEFKPETRRVSHNGTPLGESRIGVFVVGRMNPPTVGHELVIEFVETIAAGINGFPLLMLTKTEGKNNPLTASEKISLVCEAFGDKVAVASEPVSNLIEMLQSLSEQFDLIYWVTGDDHFDTYSRIIEDYNGKDFNFKFAKVVNAGKRDPNSEVFLESISATALRNAARSGDATTFANGLPSKLQAKSQEILEKVQFGINLHDRKATTLSEDIKNRIALHRYK